jgi:hypothetical protein
MVLGPISSNSMRMAKSKIAGIDPAQKKAQLLKIDYAQ